MTAPDLIELFVVPLNQLRARYMVTGAIAAILYGQPRFTGDIDIVVALTKRDAENLLKLFPADEFYAPPLETIETELARTHHGHFNIIHPASSFKADFYPAGDDRLIEWGLDHRVANETRHGVVWTAPPEYVILLKLQYWRDGGSPKHLEDIRAMLRVLGDSVDRRMIAQEARDRGLTSYWSEATGK